MRTALKYPAGTSDSDIDKAFKFLMQRMKTVDSEAGPGILLTVVNGLFSQKQAGFLNDYIIKVICDHHHHHQSLFHLLFLSMPRIKENSRNIDIRDKCVTLEVK